MTEQTIWTSSTTYRLTDEHHTIPQDDIQPGWVEEANKVDYFPLPARIVPVEDSFLRRHADKANAILSLLLLAVATGMLTEGIYVLGVLFVIASALFLERAYQPVAHLIGWSVDQGWHIYRAWVTGKRRRGLRRSSENSTD